MEASTRIPYLWDYDIDEAQFREILEGRRAPPDRVRPLRGNRPADRLPAAGQGVAALAQRHPLEEPQAGTGFFGRVAAGEASGILP